VGYVLIARMREMRNAYKILAEYGEGKTSVGSDIRRWEDNIKTDLREIG
jgi:hypothetical protein